MAFEQSRPVEVLEVVLVPPEPLPPAPLVPPELVAPPVPPGRSPKSVPKQTLS